MKLKASKYFTINEIIHSDTADKYNIDNTPVEQEIIDSLNYSVGRLDEIREGYGKPIYINSGYRSQALNTKIGGVKNSYHLKGLAFDLRWDPELFKYIQDNCQFDKLIRERSGSIFWIHLQFKRDKTKELNKVCYIKS